MIFRDWFLKNKLYLARSYSHIYVFMAPITTLIAIVTLLKVYGYQNSYFFIFLGVMIFVVMRTFGKFDVDNKIYEKELTLANDNNPQMHLTIEINNRLKKMESEINEIKGRIQKKK